MEEGTSFLYHVFGAFLFCLALSFLFHMSTIQTKLVDSMGKTVFDQAGRESGEWNH